MLAVERMPQSHIRKGFFIHTAVQNPSVGSLITFTLTPALGGHVTEDKGALLSTVAFVRHMQLEFMVFKPCFFEQGFCLVRIILALGQLIAVFLEDGGDGMIITRLGIAFVHDLVIPFPVDQQLERQSYIRVIIGRGCAVHDEKARGWPMA